MSDSIPPYDKTRRAARDEDRSAVHARRIDRGENVDEELKRTAKSKGQVAR